MEVILKKAQKQFAQNLPFVIYKKPNKNTLTALFQKNDTLVEINDFTEKGFVFASFDGSQKVLIPENQSEIIESIIDKKELLAKESSLEIPTEIEKKNFIDLVAKGIQAIENNEFKKVVLSRKETIALADFDLIDAFEKLVYLYPTTFVYCFYHPKVGTWLGATPEQLLQSNDKIVKTIALAGTQKNNDSVEVVWQNKEKEEQQFVTDYIVDNLNSVASEILVSKPYSIKAGSIWHIKTDILATMNSECYLRNIIELLHPTPAVCGLPKEKSKIFILENENYHRTFYTGFLGELNRSNADDAISSDLFVNLRCMEISGSIAHLFMGCGITKDSIPSKEWEESVNKSATMKKVLDYRN
ncbi:isochorismate synthase [Flavobacterium cellulosilyticum]|uniref:isochorismate synthase n=1 Tax=Flavobacterium cellulosilyticum TaxID=2541731 RepID=A0A4R5CBZ1_9FLAO|nr:isochorismate synthase [Flavobacterium cellulosilyticum]TDD95780.1 isochorismate synthase [Flavobacterium cellulosilyticum]